MNANDDKQNPTSSSEDEEDDDDESSSSSTDTSSDDDEIEEESEDDLLTSEDRLTPKQVYTALENKRKTLEKRLLQLRDELKAQPQADIDTKKRLLTEIKNLREKWIAIQTRLTNLKARFSHSPTPERKIPPPTKKPSTIEHEITPQPQIRIVPPPRVRTSSYSSSNRSRSSSRESRDANEKPYRDLDALEENENNQPDEEIESSTQQISSRPRTSYRDLTDDFVSSPSPATSPEPLESESIPFSNLDQLNLGEKRIRVNEENENIEEDQPSSTISKETFYNQKIPFPILHDKRDLEVINRQLKNQMREFEASRNNPLFDEKSNLISYERLKKQNEYINARMKIERLKQVKAKTQREREQNKKHFHHLLQEFRKLQRWMRAANRQSYLEQSNFLEQGSLVSEIPMPSSPKPPSPVKEEFVLPPLDLNKVTGKKIRFESSDSDDEPASEPQVPVSLSISEPRTVPEQIDSLPPSLPIPLNSTASATLDTIKNRVKNLITPTSIPSSTDIQSSSSNNRSEDVNKGDEDDDDDDEQITLMKPEKSTALSGRFTRKRRKSKRNKNKKKQTNNSTIQTTNNENDPTAIDHEDAWRRHVAMQLQFKFLQQSDPVLRALTAEAHKKLGISQEEVNEFTFDEDMMDYETAMILQRQQEFLDAAAANPFHVLRSAAAGSSSSRPNLVDILSNLNGGVASSSNEPQTPMGLLQKFFLDANKNPNGDHQSHLGLNDLSTTPPTPPTPRDILIGKKIVESLTHQDINALLKLSGSEHDDEDEDDDNGHPPSMDGDTDDDDINNLSFDDDSNDMLNGNKKNSTRWERPIPVPSRSTQSSTMTNKKSTMESLILPSFNRCTHLGRSSKRSLGFERMFPSFSKHNAGPSSTLSLILYGLSSTP